MTDALDLDALRPADTPAYMTDDWLDCIYWAIGEPDIVAAFRENTGDLWVPGLTPLDRMIDEATGRDRAFAESFIRWANVAVWGPLK